MRGFGGAPGSYLKVIRRASILPCLSRMICQTSCMPFPSRSFRLHFFSARPSPTHRFMVIRSNPRSSAPVSKRLLQRIYQDSRQEKPAEDFTSREFCHQLTLYGPLVEALYIEQTDGKKSLEPYCWEVVNPLALIFLSAQRSTLFREFLLRTLNMTEDAIVYYTDGLTSHNPLNSLVQESSA